MIPLTLGPPGSNSHVAAIKHCRLTGRPEDNISFKSSNYEVVKTVSKKPKYLGIVGDPCAVPMLYLKSPVWYENVDQEEKGEEYLATDTYFGDLDIKLVASNITEGIESNFDYKNERLYTQELAVGRIVAPDILDASALLTRTIGYWDYEFTAPLPVRCLLLHDFFCPVPRK